MKQKIIGIFVNAIVGAISSALTVYLGASAAEAMSVGAGSSAAFGDYATNVVNSVVAALA